MLVYGSCCFNLATCGCTGELSGCGGHDGDYAGGSGGQGSGVRLYLTGADKDKQRRGKVKFLDLIRSVFRLK